MATQENFLSGESLDIFFDFLNKDISEIIDEDILDEHFDEIITEETNELNTLGEFKCTQCTKTCKSKGGLTRHINTKHKENDDRSNFNECPIDGEGLQTLIKEATAKLSGDLCYPEGIRMKISSYEGIQQSSILLLPKVKSFLKGLSKKGDAEKYYQDYYSEIVCKADLYFQNLEKPYSTLLAKRVGDKLLSYFKHPAVGPANKPLEISAKELGSLQYLAGYVVKKILKKIKNLRNYKSPQSQAMIAALQCMTTKDFDDQKLIKTLTRGGLTAVNKQAESIFRIVEEHFRIETNTGHLRRIETKKMTANLIKNIDINGAYNNILVKCSFELSKETRYNLLEKLISLYLRVRAFSTARDLINKYRVEQKAKTKDKGLRKSLKNLEDQQTKKNDSEKKNSTNS